MHLQQRVTFHGTRDLTLEVGDPNYTMFVALVGYATDVDYVLLSETGGQYETGLGQIGVGGGFSRTLIKGSTTSAKVSFNSGKHILLLNARTETISYKSTDQLLIGSSFADVTGTGIAVAANKTYNFDFQIIVDADAATTGIDLSVNGPTGFVNIQYTVRYWTSTTVQAVARAANYNVDTSSTGSNGTTQCVYTLEGIFINGATAGTLIARIKREAVGSGPNVRAGSFSRATRLN